MIIHAGRYLVTGASGLMGTTALNILKNRENVEVLAVYNNGAPRINAVNVKWIQSDLCDRKACRDLAKGMDYLLHFAGNLSTTPVMAKDPIIHINSNTIINTNMLEAAWLSKVKRVVWLSSTAAYPDCTDTQQEEAYFTDDPPDLYFAVGWMYRYIEKLCQYYSEKLTRKMPVVALRPTTIYGEYESFAPEKSHMLPALVRKVVERQNPIEIWGNGEVKRNFIYAGDVAQACFLALNLQDNFFSCNIGSRTEYSVAEIANKIIAIDNYADAVLEYKSLNRNQSVLRRNFSVDSAAKKLGFTATTDIDFGIKRVIDYYRKHYTQEVQE